MPSRPRVAGHVVRPLLVISGMVCLCLVALQPFTQGALPLSADGMLHLQRTAALDHSLQADGALWPRFSSGLVYGFGAPLFHFFPPLSYYPAVLAQRLGLSFVDSWLLLMGAFTVLAGCGAFLLARHWARADLAGWFAAAAYVYSPYWLLDSVARGAYAEAAALAALPCAFYGMTRLAHYGRRRDFALALLSFALFIPLHTIITLHGTAILALYCLFLVWRARERRVVGSRLLLAGGLALALTAFYWLPALLERDFIKLGLITQQLRHIDVEGHLRPLGAVLALPLTADATQQNFAAPISLGWPQLIIAAAGTLLSWRRAQREMRPLLLCLWALLALLILLNTPASAPIWRALPLIGLTQFPWRTLGLASLVLALLSGLGACLLWRQLGDFRLRLVSLGAMLLLMLLYAVPWTSSLYQGEISLDDIRDVQAFERASGQLALSSYSEYLPIHSDAAQLDSRALAERFADGDVIPRLSESASLAILEADWRGTAARLQLDSHQTQTLTFDWLFMPGWAAFIDGQPIPVYPSSRAGLVAVDVPAGQFELEIALAPTRVQTLAAALSGLGLLGALGLLAVKPAFAAEADTIMGPVSWRWLRLVALIGIATFLLKAAVLDGRNTPLMRARFGDVTAAPALANFGNRIDLLAADLPAGPLDRPVIKVTLYWRLHDVPLPRDYSSIVRLRDPAGFVIAEAGSFAPGGLATSNWLPGAYIADAVDLRIPPYTPQRNAAYNLEVALYDAETLVALSRMNEAGNPQDARVEVAALRLQLTAADFETQNMRPLPAHRHKAGLHLLESPQLPLEARAGDVVGLNWVWQKTDAAAPRAQAQLLWLDDGGDARGRSRLLPPVADYAVVDWRLGEANRGHFSVIVPPELRSGRYEMAIDLLDSAGRPLGQRLRLDQTMAVTVPPRQFATPDYAFPSGAEWDNGIVLHGYSLAGAGRVSLVWGAGSRLLDDLRLFVHALDAEGVIRAQWDGVPVDWSRPVTGWVAGEFVTTSHNFDLAPGQYHVAVGWYRPADGERLPIGRESALRLPETLTLR